MLPILLLLDPDSLLALGKCSKRLFRLVCDQEVWRRLVGGIPEFNLERLKVLGEFAAKSDTRQDMIAEVLKRRASELANQVCTEGITPLSCQVYQVTLRIKNFPDTYKLYSCQFEKFIEVVEVMGSSTLAMRESLQPFPCSEEVVKAMESSPFSILEFLSENMFNCPLGWIAIHVERQEDLVVKFRIGAMLLYSEGEGEGGQDTSFFTIVKRSQRWEVGNLVCEHGSNWAPVASFASTGDIVRLDFDTDAGGLKKVKKEDARKIWEISGGIRVKIPAASTLYFERLAQGVWSLESGYKRPEKPKEEFDPEVNWDRLVAFAGWESEGDES